MSKPQQQQMTHNKIFLTVSAGVFMSTMDSSMVNIALPVLMRTFHSSLALTEWVVLIYLLAITVLLLFWGKMCNRYGCGRIYSRGMLIFTGGSLLCSIAPTIYILILFRFLQALGASMMMATGPALIKSIYPADRLGRGLGLLGVATSLGLMTGPVVSGLLLHYLNWRAIFWVTAPVGLFFFLMTRKVLTDVTSGCCDDPAAESGKVSGLKGLDRTGSLLWAGVVSLTILIVSHATTWCCSKGVLETLLFVAGLVAMLLGWVVFIRYEWRHATPFLPVSLFQQRFFSMALLSSSLSFAVLFFVMILMPFYLARILQFTSDHIGYVMMAVPLSVFVVSPLAGRLHDGIGARIVATFGLFCCFISLLLLTGLTAETSPQSVAIRLVLLGFGQAMFLSPNSAAALSGVSEDQVGVTSSLLATARNFGMLAGTALAGLIFALSFSTMTGGLDLKDFTPDHGEEFLFALKRSFQVGAFLSFASVVASWMRQDTGRRKSG